MQESSDCYKAFVVKDLEIQWKDHHHMRDQTWKIFLNTILFFLGVVGLEIKDLSENIMKISWLFLTFIAGYGAFIGWRHLKLQKMKFRMITHYENVLGLGQVKQEILSEKLSRFAVETGIYIVCGQWTIACFSFLFFLSHLGFM